MLFCQIFALSSQQPKFVLRPGADALSVEVVDATNAFSANERISCALMVSFSPLVFSDDEISYQSYQTFEYKTTYRNSFVFQLSDSHRTNNVYTMAELLKKLVTSAAVDAVLTMQTDQTFAFQGKFSLEISTFAIEQAAHKTFAVSATADALQLSFSQEVSEPLLVNFEAQNTSIRFEATPVSKLISFPVSFLTRSTFAPYKIRVVSKTTLESFLADTAKLSQKPFTAPVIAYNAQRVHFYVLGTRFNVQFNDSLGQLYGMRDTVASFIITDRQSRFQFIKQVLVRSELNFELSRLEFSKFTLEYDEVISLLKQGALQLVMYVQASLAQQKQLVSSNVIMTGDPFSQSFSAEFGFSKINVTLRNFSYSGACDIELQLNTEFAEQRFVKKLTSCQASVSFGVEDLVYPHVDNWYAQINGRQNNVQLTLTKNGIAQFFTYSTQAPPDAPVDPVLPDPNPKIVAGIVIGVICGFALILGFILLMVWVARRHRFGVASLSTLRVAA